VRRNTNWIMVGLVAATWLLVQQLESQQMVTRRLDASSTVFLHELGAAVGVAEDSDQVRFLIVPPAAARAPGAAEVDVEQGDVVLMAAGRRVRTVDDLRSVYEDTAEGDELKLGLRRGDRRFLIAFTRAAAPEAGTLVSHGGGGAQVMQIRVGGDEGGSVEVLPELGVVLAEEDGTPRVSARLPLPGTESVPLSEGDLITAVNGVVVTSLAELMASYGAIEVGGSIELTLVRGGETQRVELVKTAADTGAVTRRAQ